MNLIARTFPRLYIRLFKGRGYWHNRIYLRGYRYTEHPDGSGIVKFRGRMVNVRNLESMRIPDPVANVLLSGPSVGEIRDPRLLFNRFLVAVNGSHELFDESAREIDAYVVCDPDFVKRKFEVFKRGVMKSRRVVLDHHIIHAAMTLDQHIFDNIELYLITDLVRPFMRNKGFERHIRDNGVIERYGVRFSTNPSTGFYSNLSVAITVIQILYWLKFRKIHLFGLDLTSAGRFYKEDSPEQTTLGDDYHQAIEPTFRLIRDEVLSEKFVLINCNPGSRLPDSIIPQCDANECLAGDPALPVETSNPP